MAQLLMLVSLFATVFLNGQSSRPALELRFTAFQTGSPVAITDLQTSDDFPFKKIRLRNVGDKAASAVTLGVILAPVNGRDIVMSDRILVKSSTIRLADLEPGATADIGDLDSYLRSFLTRLAMIRTGRADANLGLLSVTLSDGTQWTSSAVQRLYFPTPTNSGEATRCMQEGRLLASTDPQTIPATLECEPDTTSPTNCTKFSGSCQMTVCGCAQYGCYCNINCDCRKCVWR